MIYHSEFHDYPTADLPAIPTGFVDVSWHNDTCPSFYNEVRRLVIWCDYAAPDKREFGEYGASRYCLNRTSDDGATEDAIWAGDDWAELLTELAKVTA